MLPTIIVASIIAALFVTIVANSLYNRKNGKSTCSCGCAGCGMADVCHNKK